MCSSIKIFTPIAMLALSACSPALGPDTSRFDGGMLSFAAQANKVEAQATALTKLSYLMVAQTSMQEPASASQSELIPTSEIETTLRKTTAQMARIAAELPDHLSAHAETLAQLDRKRASGAIDEIKFNAARAEVSTERRAIAAALMQVEADANQAAANLRNAQTRGQTDLGLHITTTSNLATQAHSAGSTLSLL